jgi:hypothetical protein
MLRMSPACGRELGVMVKTISYYNLRKNFAADSLQT